MQTKQIIKKLLEKNKDGMTITDIHKSSELSRCAIRDALAELRGAGEVEYRKVGMAKLYGIKKWQTTKKMQTKKVLKERIEWLKEEQKREYNPYRERNIDKLKKKKNG